MHLYTEAWADSSRWRLLNGASFMLDDGHLLAVQDNPLLQFNQNAEMGLVVEMILYPDDDLQLALVKPSASIDFTTQADITYFGIIYERQFGSYYHQFVLNHRSAWDGPLLDVASPALDNLATYRLLFSASEGAVRVKIFDALDALVWDVTQPGVLTGEMTFLVNPGRMQDGAPSSPWIGLTKFMWGATPSQVAAAMDGGAIVVPPLVAPSIVDQPSFQERQYSVWESPSFGGSGSFSVTARSPLPPGLSLVFQGDRLVIFGSPAAGSAGAYPLLLEVTDGVNTAMVTVLLDLTVASQWVVDPGVIPESSVALGDWYYQIAGGPVRKEFHDNR